MRSTSKLDSNQLKRRVFFVHATRVIPQDGILTPGNSYLLESYKDIFSPTLLPAASFIANARTTLHWTVNHMIEDHQQASFSHCDLAIVEASACLFPYLYGGYPEDYFSIGPYALSKEATLFYPAAKHQAVTQHLGCGFKGTLISYSASEDLRAKVKAFVAAKLGADYPFVCFNQKKSLGLAVTLAEAHQKPTFSYAEYLLHIHSHPSFYRENQLYLLNAKGERERISPNAVTARQYADIKFDFDAQPKDMRVTVGINTMLCSDYFKAWHEVLGPMVMHDATLLRDLERDAQSIQAILDIVMRSRNPLFFDQPVQTSASDTRNLTLLTFLQSACKNMQSIPNKILTELKMRDFPLTAQQFFENSMRARLQLWLGLLATVQRQRLLDDESIRTLLKSATLPELQRPVNVTLSLTTLREMNPKVSDYGHALRLWGAGQLPQWIGAEIIRQAPTHLNEAGAGSGKTALDFAIQRNNVHALQKLRLWGAERGIIAHEATVTPSQNSLSS